MQVQFSCRQAESNTGKSAGNESQISLFPPTYGGDTSGHIAVMTANNTDIESTDELSACFIL